MNSPILLSLIILIFGVINAFIAKAKGFNPVLWFFTAGFLGLIVVALLPSAKKAEEDTEEYNHRKSRANWWGYVILIFAAVVIIIQIITFLA
jgi:L-asparagine transporter-like permease